MEFTRSKGSMFVLNNTRHRPVISFLPNALRPLLSALLVFTLIATPISPLVSNASAGMELSLPLGIETMKSGYPLGRPNEVADFNPHFGMLPITVPAPIATYGRGLWCYGPIYFCYIVGCVCIPLPKNWCHDFYECLMTNVINLEATLMIKHAWPKGGERLREHSNLTVLKPDNYYRDKCMSSSKLDYNRFDPKTGGLIVEKVKGDDGKETHTPANSELYDDTSTGMVTGSKPPLGTCMSRVNNSAFAGRDPKFATPTNGNAAFSYYVNAGDDPFAGIGKDTEAPETIYGTSNRYLSTTFFLSGRFGCPAEISGIPVSGKIDEGSPAKTAAKWKEAASRCYDYFIFQRATHPEWTLERPGSSTDDPLTLDKDRGGNPDLAIFNSCQPLMSGPNSRAVISGLSAEGRGFAPVLQYQRPDLDEADYNPQEHLQRSFATRFPGRPIPGFQNLFPCVKNMSDAGTIVQTDWEVFNNTLIINYAISAFVELTVLRIKWGPQYFIPMRNEPYASSGSYKLGYCPNVEKIIIPTHPLAPRNDIRSLQYPEGIFNPSASAISEAKHQVDLLLSGPLYLFNRNITNKYFTDREYSHMTSFFTPEDRFFNKWSFGYSDYNNPTKVASIEGQIERAKHPEVMCAVVPVDILEPRRKAFNSCIMERINFNFVTWRRRNFLSFYYSTQNSDGGLNLSLPVNPIAGDVITGILSTIPAAITAGISFFAGKDGTLKPWEKPCVTRFYESDTFEKCPVAMSIQQCCRIIVKDVVPMNYIKIRTCEGLRQKRDIVFRYDHIFDFSQRAIDTFQDDWAIANAKTPAEKLIAEQIILIKHLDFPVPIVSQGGKSMKTPTSKEEFNAVYDMNQKLTLIGCDDTEPETYSFAYHFGLSKWSDQKVITPIPSPAFAISKLFIPINQELKGLRIVSDGIIAEARKLAAAITDVEGVSAADAWDVYQSVKNPIIAKIKEAEDLTNKLLLEEQKALKRFETAQRNVKKLLSPHELLALAAGAISIDIPEALGRELIAAGNDWGIKKAAAKAAAIALEAINYVEGQTLAKAEGKAKDLITKWLKIREKYIVEKGKNIADDIVTKGIGAIKGTQGSPIKSAIDKSIAALTSNPVTELNTILTMGSGGAHMPYMRRWDTGTSAGNPLHGGSFINTLGSYDVVIGVGHEERDFSDATNTTTDVKTVQDQSAIAAALKRLEAAREAFAKIQRDYNSVCPAYIGMWNFDTYSINYNRYTYTRKLANGSCGGIYDGARNPCYPAQMPYPNLNYPFVSRTGCMNNAGAHWVACNVAGNTDCLLAELNRAQAEMDAAEAAFQAARRQSITTITTTSDKADIPSGESMIKTAHMGRVDGWDGLKGHQMLSIYRKNMSCIGRHEKLFKGEGAENFVLAKAGTGYRSKDGKDFPWPLAWRGYVTDPDNEFVKEGPARLTGLDNAKMGDIIIYTLSGMKRIAFVDYVNNTDPKFVKIESWDQGKFPTSSGASLTLGTSVDRTIYKSAVPEMEKIKALPAGKKALVGNQPSCEDPSYTSCMLGGSLDIIGKDGAVVENIPNSTWDNVTIYRPSLDTANRQCPMINTKKDADGNLKVPLSEMPTDSISFCINAGYDPPVIRNVGYDGPGAGNISDTTLCGPEWGSCKFYSDKATLAEKKKESLCFPGREVCENPNSVPLPPPPPGSEDQCTAEEYDAALRAYQADLKKISDARMAEDEKIRKAIKAVEDAANALRDYRNRITAELAEKRLGKCTKDIDSRLAELRRRLAEAQRNLADAQARGDQAEIDRWTTQIENINAEIRRLSNILCLTGSLRAAIEDLRAKQAAALAARRDLERYIEENPFDDNTPRAEIDRIAANIARLRYAADRAAAEAEAAQARVAQLLRTLDCLCPPSAADKADQDAANARIKELEDALAKAIRDLEALEQDLDKIRNMKVPKMSCPYVPLDEQ